MKEKEEKFNIDVIKVFEYITILPLLTEIFTSIISRWNGASKIGTYFLYMIAWILVVRIVIKYKKIRINYFFASITMFAFLGISYYIFEDNRRCIIENMITLVIITLVYIPIALFLAKTTNFNSFKQDMKKLSIVGISVAALGVAFGDLLTNANYMEFSIRILPFVMFIYYSLRQKYTNVDLVFTIIGFILLFVFGGRMSLLSFCVFVLINEIRIMTRNNLTTKLMKMLFIIVVLITLLLFQNNILIFISNLLDNVGIESRNIVKLLNGEITESSSRDRIYEYARQEIGNMGFKIYGIFGDRVVLRQYLPTLSYVHNIFYEILFSWGYILGTIIIICLIFKIIKVVFQKQKDEMYKVILLYLFCAIFMRLLVSGSYLTEYGFSIFIGMLYNKKIQGER